QIFLVNGRWVQSAALSQALRQAYGNLLPHGRFPAAILWLTVPPDRLDVNVHPTKREGRFADPGSVFSLVAAACAPPLAALPPPFAVVQGAPGDALPAWGDRVRERPPEGPRSQMPLLLPVPGGDRGAEDGEPPGAAALGVAFGPPGAGTMSQEPDAPPAAPGQPASRQLHPSCILAPVRGGAAR